MAALFGSSSSRSGKSNLLEFKAGKMYLKGKMCHPDKRKGLVVVHQSDDSLMHFSWKDRQSGKKEDDLIIFPDDVEFKHVPQCTTGRVYVLKFKSSTRKFIFWLQESKTEKDEENCKKVNDLLNNPPTPGSTRAGGGGGSSGLAGLQPADLANLASEPDLQSLLNGMNQQQLLQLIGGMGGLGGSGGALPGALRGGRRPSSTQSSDSTTPLRVQSAPEGQAPVTEPVVSSPQPRPTTAAALPSQATPRETTTTTGGATTTAGGATTTAGGATTTAGGATTTAGGAATGSGGSAIQLSDLQNILSNITTPAAPESDPINLGEALNSETLIPILADPAVQERLAPFLPKDVSLPSTQEELRSTVLSPQFQQALASFSQAISSGQLGPVMAQFGLGQDAVEAATNGDVQAFVQAMQEAEKKDDNKGSEEKMDES